MSACACVSGVYQRCPLSYWLSLYAFLCSLAAFESVCMVFGYETALRVHISPRLTLGL